MRAPVYHGCEAGRDTMGRRYTSVRIAATVVGVLYTSLYSVLALVLQLLRQSPKNGGRGLKTCYLGGIRGLRMLLRGGISSEGSSILVL